MFTFITIDSVIVRRFYQSVTSVISNSELSISSTNPGGESGWRSSSSSISNPLETSKRQSLDKLAKLSTCFDGFATSTKLNCSQIFSAFYPLWLSLILTKITWKYFRFYDSLQRYSALCSLESLQSIWPRKLPFSDRKHPIAQMTAAMFVCGTCNTYPMIQ